MVRKCLSKDFARSVWMQVKTRRIQSDKVDDDDQIKVTDYLDVAMKLSYGSRRLDYIQEDYDSDYERVDTKPASRSTVKPSNIKFEETPQWSEMTHSINAQMDKMKALETSVVNLHGLTVQRIDDLLKEVQTLKVAPRPYAAAQQEQQYPRPPPTSNFRPNGPCFFCGEDGHVVLTCPTKHSYVAKGIIKSTDVGLRMANGSAIPTIPGVGINERTMKERIDAALAKKQNYLGEPSMTASGYYNVTPEDLDMYSQQTLYQGGSEYNNYQSQMVNLLNENRLLRAAQQPIQPGFYNGTPQGHSQQQSQMYGAPYNGNGMTQSQVVQPTSMSYNPPQPTFVQNNTQSQKMDDPMSARLAQLEQKLAQLSTSQSQSQQNDSNGAQSGF